MKPLTQIFEGTIRNSQLFLLAIFLTAAGCKKTNNNDNGPQGTNKPAAPVTQTPPATINSGGFTASWKKVAGADKYLVYVAADNQFQQPLSSYNPATVTDTSVTVTNLNQFTTYYYRVQASAAGVVSAYSNTVPVTTTGKQWIVSTFAGTISGSGGYADGQGASARFVFPQSIAIDASDNLYVADNLSRIRKITPSGMVSTLTGSATTGTVDGPPASAQLTAFGLTYDRSSNNLFAGDQNCIRKIDMNGNVATVAGNPGIAGVIDGQGSAARLYGPNCLTADPSGNIYFYETGNNTGIKDALRVLAPSGYVSTMITPMNITSTVAGGIIYNNGSLYFGNSWGYDILKISLSGSINVFTGATTASGSYKDGDISIARFGYLTGMIADAQGNFYVCDNGNHLIRKISNSNVVSTFAGVYGGGAVFDGPALAVDMSSANGIVVDSKGNIFIISAYDHCIRKISYQ